MHNRALKAIRLLLAIFILLAAVQTPVQAQYNFTFMVDSVEDFPDEDPGDGACAGFSSENVLRCSLRAAIEEANAQPLSVYTSILFTDAVRSGTVKLFSSLPPLSGSSVFLWGRGQNYENTRVDGSQLQDGEALLTIAGSTNEIGGLEIFGVKGTAIHLSGSNNSIEGNYLYQNRNGVVVQGSDMEPAEGNVISDNIIGLPWNRLGEHACGIWGNTGDGIAVIDWSNGTRIEDNMVVCSGMNGISIGTLNGQNGQSMPENTLIGNNGIGTDRANALANHANGIRASFATSTTIKDNIISGNGEDGILIEVSYETQILGNYIGVTGTGETALPNGKSGLHLSIFVQHTLIGDPTGASFNLISGNNMYGIQVEGIENIITEIYSNRIGTDVSGSAAIPNQLYGIGLMNEASGNLIGGRGSIKPNLISGNKLGGILLEGAGEGNWIAGNTIGLNLTGTSALPNTGPGIHIKYTGYTNIGGGMEERNFISGNSGCGVQMQNGIGIELLGNVIGLDTSLSKAVPNGDAGVCAEDSIIIMASGEDSNPQYLSGNTRQGLRLKNGLLAMFNGNFIGTNNTGTAPLGNGAEGVLLENVFDSFIYADFVTHNAGRGIVILGESNVDVWPKTIYGNGGLPIDLNGDGPTKNDAGDVDSGPNGLINTPVITSVNGNQISGTVFPAAKVRIYRAIGNPAEAGGGGAFLMEVDADASGKWSATLPGSLTASLVTLQAYDAQLGITSELMARPQAFLPTVVR